MGQHIHDYVRTCLCICCMHVCMHACMHAYDDTFRSAGLPMGNTTKQFHDQCTLCVASLLTVAFLVHFTLKIRSTEDKISYTEDKGVLEKHYGHFN